MASIYQFSVTTTYLHSIWLAKKSKNSSFSIRAWAKKLDLQSYTPLYEIISGKRRLPKNYLFKIAQDIGLDSHEILYFETMVDMERAKSTSEEHIYRDRLEKMRGEKKINMVELDSFDCLQNPLHMVILEACCLKDVELNYDWLEKNIRIEVTEQEVKEAIDRLKRLDLIFRDEDGNYHKTNNHITNKQDVNDLTVQQFHKNVLSYAAEEIGNQDVSEREYGSYVINIAKSDIPKAKRLIRNFFVYFMDEIEADGGVGEEIYMLGVQLFSLTKT